MIISVQLKPCCREMDNRLERQVGNKPKYRNIKSVTYAHLWHRNVDCSSGFGEAKMHLLCWIFCSTWIINACTSHLTVLVIMQINQNMDILQFFF